MYGISLPGAYGSLAGVDGAGKVVDESCCRNKSILCIVYVHIDRI